MKPEKLILSAWGPYKDRVEVDFTRLKDRGLFLITGPTGAGKTTIFDGITYVLYGSMSGEMREKNSVRSDFAAEDTATYAELWMQHGGKAYHIIRNPEYLRPRRKKGGGGAYTREKERAVLYLPDGSVVEGSTEVNRRIQEILALDYRQFKQVSMIAQGEFARLLGAPPAEKTRIFRELFSTALYDRFAGILKSRSGELYRQVTECRSRMEEDVHMLRAEERGYEELAELTKGNTQGNTQGNTKGNTQGNTQGITLAYDRILANLTGLLQELSRELDRAEKYYTACEKEAAARAERIHMAGQMNEKLHKLRELQRQQKKLADRKEEMELLEDRLRQGRKAAGLMEDHIKAENARQQQASMEQRLREEKQELEVCMGREREWESCCNGKIRDEIREAYGRAAVCEERRGLLKEANRQLMAKQEELGRLQEQYLQQEEAAAVRKKEFEAADQAYKRAAAGIVARQVREGEPCPVCGSLSHPRIAETAEGIPDEKGLQSLRKNYEREQKRLMEIHGRAAACQGEAAACLKRKEELEGQAQESVEELERTPEGVRHILAEMSREDYESAVSRYEALRAQIKEKQDRIRKGEEELRIREETGQRLGAVFAEGCREAGFGSVEAFERAVLPVSEMERMEKACKDYHAQLRAAEELTGHLLQETQGQEEADLEALRKDLKEQQKEKQKALDNLQEKNHRLQEFRRIRASLQEKQRRLEELSRQYGLVKDLDNMASGNNPRRLVFEQYVLAGYFEEILRAANLRLDRMTGGRYELSRLEEVSDGRSKDNLEMRILDYYTGKYRSVRTLSGGEAFKASLSLALGMSDVIQGYSGGIRVDTLFIDEGFGALDSESLEQACQTLMSLAEKDRLIGIISHVPELAEKIQKQIVITRTNTGSRVEVSG
ncbi:MAG: SMC family ATPase [Lachnospiraceae bacterium]|nr:SMC family ATPase [Lachnospiraceae bacterium]